MTFCKKLFLLLVVCLTAFIGHGKMTSDDSLDAIFCKDFDDDSYFVTIPTYTGNYLGLVIGAIPAACVASGFQFANANPSTVRESAIITLSFFAKPIGLLVGLPFKFIKVVLWDSPKYIFGGLLGDTDPPVELPSEL